MRNVSAQYERRGTMSEMLGKKIYINQRWPFFFDLETEIRCQQDGDELKKKYDGNIARKRAEIE
ncbi:hypothetical protein OU792_15985 [Algoriphagus sp. NF]|nr:hypothetical protein [Algoriphagus sp. NF]